MNKENLNPDDAKLSSLLRESRVAPPLPPRFQETVWRRIADSESTKTSGSLTWIDSLLALVMQPRFAFAALAVLIAVGAAFGIREGSELARHDAQIRYLASVAPTTLR
jgi:hypothetical protein